MREIYYNSDITHKSAGELKLLTLYYDKITIVNDVVYTSKFSNEDGKLKFAGVEDLQFIPPNFRDNYKLLLDEGIMHITKRDEDADDLYTNKFAKKISQIVNGNEDFIFPLHPERSDAKIITEEVYDIMKSMLGFEWGKPIEHHYIWWYYSFKLKWLLELLMEGNTCITSSNNLQHLFSSFIKNTGEDRKDFSGRSKSLALDALKVSLPNPEMLSIEDILELKIKLKDELIQFSSTINEIEVRNKNLLSDDVDQAAYQALFFSEIQKPLSELELKLKNLKSKTFRTFVDKLKDYKSYTPLIGTVVASMPVQYAVLSSLGMTIGQTYLEYKEEHRELQNNGLYFLMKI